MIKKQLLVFILRTVASIFGMWLCISLFATSSPSGDNGSDLIRITFGDFELLSIPNSMESMLYIVAGVVFSLLNSIVKPLAKLFALPLAILTMGLSTLVINFAMMFLTVYLISGLEMTVVSIIISSIIMSVINSLVNLLLLPYNR